MESEVYGMNLCSSLRVLMSVLVLSLLVACQEQAPEVARAEVVPNQDFLTAFGEPPVVRQGRAFARVAYYPVRGQEQVVQPIPVFIYQETGQLAALLDRVVGQDLVLGRKDLTNPFPPETTVSVVSQDEGMVTLNLEFAKSPDREMLAAAAAVLVACSSQFDPTSRVFLSVAGKPFPGMPDHGFSRKDVQIVPPAAPKLLQVVGSWDGDARDPKELMVLFDRPVTVEEFSLQIAPGQKLEGRYFTSVFDMAVVVHPEAKTPVLEGQEFLVSWKVVDALGRRGEGAGRYSLLRRGDGHRH